MADSRFKPIGGMFQGVRGSTDIGGASQYADKLVKLNKDGTIDTSLLSLNIQALADQLDDMQKSITFINEESIPGLSMRLNDLDNDIKAEQEARNNAVTELRTDLQKNIEAQKTTNNNLAGSIKELTDSITPIALDVTDLKKKSEDHTTRLQTLESNDNAINLRLENIDASISYINGDISSITSKQTSMDKTLNDIVLNLTTIASTQTTQNSQITMLTTDFNSYKAESVASITSINSRLDALSAKVDEIFNRIVKCS